MKLAVFEGTPEEIKKVWEGMNTKTEISEAISVSGNGTTEEEEIDEFASVEFCRAVLGRRSLPATQQKMYRAAYAAYPEALTYEDLKEELDYTPSQMAGFWGAHGRRVSHTEDRENQGEMFDWVDNDCFKLSENLKRAIELEGLVK